MIRRTTASAIALALVLGLGACGGGGSPDTSTPGGSSTGNGTGTGTGTGTTPPAATNTAPIAKAGANRSVIVGTTVALDGSTSTDAEGNPLSYTWSLVRAPSTSGAWLDKPAEVVTRFIPDVVGTYVVSLVVNDGQLSSAPVEVSIEVTPGNPPPVVTSPADRTVVTGSTVALDASTIATAPSGSSLNFMWQLLSKPAGSTAVIAQPMSAQTSFRADREGIYQLRLLIDDGKTSTDPVSFKVTASSSNIAPVANAGLPIRIVSGESVMLDGTASDDANGDEITYQWTLVTQPGTGGALTEATTATPILSTTQAGRYEARLVVSDGRLNSAPSVVKIDAVAPLQGALGLSASDSFNLCGLSGEQAVVVNATTSLWTFNGCGVTGVADNLVVARFRNNSSGAVEMTDIVLTAGAIRVEFVVPAEQRLIDAGAQADFVIMLTEGGDVSALTARFSVTNSAAITATLGGSLALP